MPLWYVSDLARIWFSAQALTVGLPSIRFAGSSGTNPTLSAILLRSRVASGLVPTSETRENRRVCPASCVLRRSLARATDSYGFPPTVHRRASARRAARLERLVSIP